MTNGDQQPAGEPQVQQAAGQSQAKPEQEDQRPSEQQDKIGRLVEPAPLRGASELHQYGRPASQSSRRHNHKANQKQAEQPSQQQVHISADYLAQLIKDKKQLAAFPAVFLHVQRLIDDEIHKVRQILFQLNDVVNSSQPLELPEPAGDQVQLQEKIYVPVDEHPEYNFVGRLLGPRGMTAKQLEQETGCKIMIRGRGSMRDKKKVSLIWAPFVSVCCLSVFYLTKRATRTIPV